MREQRLQQANGGRRWKTILFWLVVVLIGVAPLVPRKFAITQFVIALVFIVLWGRTIEREFAKFG